MVKGLVMFLMQQAATEKLKQAEGARAASEAPAGAKASPAASPAASPKVCPEVQRGKGVRVPAAIMLA